jgi:dTDP-glucose 4,6-dehydratase
MDGLPLPLYGKGENVRNWIHVRDHCEALDVVLRRGKPGEIYNVSADREFRNIDVARRILKLLGQPDSLMTFVRDRPGHDLRYAPNAGKIKRLGWRLRRPFEKELVGLVEWYRANEPWWRAVKKGGFQSYFKKQYAKR